MTDLDDVKKIADEALKVAYENKSELRVHKAEYKAEIQKIMELKSDIKTLGNRMWVGTGSIIAACVSVILALVMR